MSVDGEQQQIAEARVKTGDFIARLMMAYTGFAAFCVFALDSPDRLMIDAQANLNMPFAGTVSFLAFMVVAPVVLIGMRVYLEVYVQRWRQLDEELDADSEPKTLSPLKQPLLRCFFYLMFYFLLTAMLVLFMWKARAKEDWGEVFLLLTVVCTVAQVYQFVRRRWSLPAALVVAVPGSLFVFVLLGVDYEWELPHRGLELSRENLEAAYLVGKDLRLAVLVGANLTGARLVSVDLTDADLTRADLTNADLTFADLTNATLTNANLTNADLSFTDLTQDQLDSACISFDGKPPILPRVLKPLQKVCVT